MQEILGIEVLYFGLGIGQLMTPKSSLHELREQSGISSYLK